SLTVLTESRQRPHSFNQALGWPCRLALVAGLARLISKKCSRLALKNSAAEECGPPPARSKEQLPLRLPGRCPPVFRDLARAHVICAGRGASASTYGPERLTRFQARAVRSDLNQEDYDVLADGAVVGHIFLLDAVGPQDHPWMWASGHSADSVTCAAHGYEP